MSSPILMFRKLTGAWPRTAQEFFDRASQFSFEQQHEAAIDDLNKALRRCAEATGTPVESQEFQFLAVRAEEYMALKQYDEAWADLEEVDRKYREDWGALDEERVHCLMEMGDYRRALAIIDDEADPADLESPDLDRGRCLDALGRTEEARQAFDKVIRETDEEWAEEAYFYRGRFLLKQGDSEAALTDIRRALDIHGKDDECLQPPLESWVIEAFRLRADALKAVGKRTDGDSDARRAGELEEAQHNFRPRSVRRINNEHWYRTAIEASATLLGISIFTWILGYGFLSGVQPLPPLSAWWRAVPISMLAVAVMSVIGFTVADRMDERRSDQQLDQSNSFK